MGAEWWPGDWHEFLTRIKETPAAIWALWRDPQTRELMQFYAGLLLVIGLVCGFRFYRAAKRKNASR